MRNKDCENCLYRETSQNVLADGMMGSGEYCTKKHILFKEEPCADEISGETRTAIQIVLASLGIGLGKKP